MNELKGALTMPLDSIRENLGELIYLDKTIDLDRSMALELADKILTLIKDHLNREMPQKYDLHSNSHMGTACDCKACCKTIGRNQAIDAIRKMILNLGLINEQQR